MKLHSKIDSGKWKNRPAVELTCVVDINIRGGSCTCCEA